MTQQYPLTWDYYYCTFDEDGFIRTGSFLFSYSVSGAQPSTFQFYNMFQGACGDNGVVACGYFIDPDPNNSYIVNIAPTKNAAATSFNPPCVEVYNQTQNEMTLYITDGFGTQREETLSAGGVGTYDLEVV